MKNLMKKSKTNRSISFMSVLMTMIALVWAMNLQASSITLSLQASNKNDAISRAFTFEVINMGYHYHSNGYTKIWHREFTIDWGNGHIDELGLAAFGDGTGLCTYQQGELPYALGDTAYYTITINVPDADINLFTCTGLNITSLNLGGCLHLENLHCPNNRLTVLDLNPNTMLKKLNCNDNQLTTLNLSNKVFLAEVTCAKNRLTDLNLTGSIHFSTFDCSDNKITTLNFSGCAALSTLKCFKNQLQNLNLSGCTALKNLYCDNNQLAILNLSGCKAIEYIDCKKNEIELIILQESVPLRDIKCDKNRLLLSNLHNISAKISSDYCNKDYGTQTIPLRKIRIGEVVDYSAEKEFDGFVTNFYVSKIGNDGYYQTAIIDEDYSISGGIITFHKAGSYSVIMSNPQGVPNSIAFPTSVTATFTVNDGTGITASAPSLNLNIYPNPTTGQLTIDNGELKINSIEIFDVYGRIIVNCQLSIVNSIDISDLANGVYFLKISTEKGMVTKKIVKY